MRHHNGRQDSGLEFNALALRSPLGPGLFLRVWIGNRLGAENPAWYKLGMVANPNGSQPVSNNSKRAIWGWSLYDWANSAFTTTVLAGFFPVFFKHTYSQGESAVVVTSRLATASSLAILVVVVLAPVLGAIADVTAFRKGSLALGMLLGSAATAVLAFIGRGDWWTAALVFAIANIGFSLSNVFYDSLLVSVAKEHERDRVSALGYALGYLGGGLLFLVNVVMVLRPALFHIRDADLAVRLSFISVAVWWIIFTVPLLRWVREPKGEQRLRVGAAVSGVLSELWMTAKALPRQRTLLVTQFVGFPAAILFGRLGERWGAQRSVLLGIAVYAVVTVFATQMHTAGEFYALAATVGLVQGGVQSLSRSIYSRLIPAERSSEYFGFYGVLDKSAAIFGPLLMGWVGLYTHSSRLGILSILVLFI